MNNLEKRKLINEIIENNFNISYQIEYPALYRYLEDMEQIKFDNADKESYMPSFLTSNDIDDIDLIPDEFFISKTECREEENKKLMEEYEEAIELVEYYSNNKINEINLYDRILIKKINLIKNNELKELLKIENMELIKRINWRELPEVDFSLFNSVWLEILKWNREIIKNKIKKLEEELNNWEKIKLYSHDWFNCILYKKSNWFYTDDNMSILELELWSVWKYKIIKKEEEQIETKSDDDNEDDILKLNIFNYVLYKHLNIEKKFIYSTFQNVDIKTNYILSNMPISEISNILEKYKNEIDTKDEIKIFNKLKEYVNYNKKQK